MTQAQIDILDRIVSAPAPASQDVDLDLLETILLQVGGFFWYRCVVRHDSPPFSDQDRSRSGWVLFIPIFVKGKLSVEIVGMRLAHSIDDGKLQGLVKPRPWVGKGAIVKQGRQLMVEWDNKYEQGRNHELIEIELDRSRWRGTFEHVTKQDRLVEGEVSYLRISENSVSPADLEGKLWIPDGIDLSIHDGLKKEAVREWSRRLYTDLDEEQKRSVSDPNFYLDLVSRRIVAAGAARQFKKDHPMSALRLFNRDDEPSIEFGWNTVV